MTKGFWELTYGDDRVIVKGRYIKWTYLNGIGIDGAYKGEGSIGSHVVGGEEHLNGRQATSYLLHSHLGGQETDELHKCVLALQHSMQQIYAIQLITFLSIINLNYVLGRGMVYLFFFF